MRVLVVEDDALLGDAIQAGLKQAGYAVDWMKDGVSAEQALGTEPYAAVVLDLGLPRLSGLEVLSRLRSRKAPAHNEHIPVLILTALDSVDDRIKGLDSGADDYLAKPFDMGNWRHAYAPWCADPAAVPHRRCKYPGSRSIRLRIRCCTAISR